MKQEQERKQEKKLGIFGGTYEGRLLAEFCQKEGICAAVSVATPYGGQLLEGNINTGRMDAQAMTSWIRQQAITAVVDATHPFAREASEQIRTACAAAKAEYRRLRREELDSQDTVREKKLLQNILWVNSVEEAAALLTEELLHYPEKKALLTTGSKELSCFARDKTPLSRLFIRVLPSIEAINSCLEAGFLGKQIIAMQGPFSREMNEAVLHTIHASYLVTKESGQTGGFQEKAEAALACGCQVIAIKRPEENVEGESLAEIKHWLLTGWKSTEKAEASVNNREIILVGIGTGGIGQITWEGIQALGKADAFIGASRMIESGKEICRAVMDAGAKQENWISPENKQERITYRAEEMLSWLEDHPEVKSPAVVFSGDTGFYSGAKGLLELVNKKQAYSVRVLPGISSLSYFAAKIGRPWANVETVSFHGREEDVDWTPEDKKERFFLLDGTERLHRLCRYLLAHGQADARLWIGENLSYPAEKIISGRPEEVLSMGFGKLLAAWVIPKLP